MSILVTATLIGALGITPTVNHTVGGTVHIFGPVGTTLVIKIDGVQVGQSPDNSWFWDTTQVANGNHLYEIDEYNGGGHLTHTDMLSITVAN